MVNKELVDYIEQALKDGFSEEIVRSELLTAGWMLADVNDGFRLVRQKRAGQAEQPMSRPAGQPTYAGTQPPFQRQEATPVAPLTQQKTPFQQKPPFGEPSPPQKPSGGMPTLEKIAADITKEPRITPDQLKIPQQPPSTQKFEPFKKPEQSPPQTPSVPPPAAEVAEKPKRKSKTKLIVAAAAAIVVLVGGYAGAAFWFKLWPFAEEYPRVTLPLPEPPLGEEQLFPAVVNLARQNLATELGVGINDIRVIDVEDVIWPDGCLGLPASEPCTSGEVEGYRVIFEESGQEYIYHTDREELFRPGDAEIEFD